MAEQTDKSQLFYREVKTLTEKIRHLLCEQNPTPLLLADSINAVDAFKEVVSTIETDSFLSIIERVSIILRRHLAAETIPTKIEIETIELASDWLDQLAILYKENLPEPKSLVAELLYTFDLVECSQDAVSLVELVAAHTGPEANKRVDPFSEDPEFDVQERAVSSHRDPFADDPGFGLEFDLLQRTVTFVVESNAIDADPFKADPSKNMKKSDTSSIPAIPTSATAPYDLFADDPPPVGE